VRLLIRRDSRNGESAVKSERLNVFQDSSDSRRNPIAVAKINRDFYEFGYPEVESLSRPVRRNVPLMRKRKVVK
jgi:hypothetical protein